MGRRCSVCTHHAREAIEAAVYDGASLAEAAALYVPLTKSALGRHMAEHVTPVKRSAVSDFSEPLAASPMMRVRERLAPVKPVALEPRAVIGNVVAFPSVAPPPVEMDIATREANPLTVAILLQHGYSHHQIARRFGVDEAAMMTLLAELEDAYTRQAAGFSSSAVIGRLIWKAEYAIAELERLYQTATQQGRNRDARDCRRMILAERQELRDILRENGITRPVPVDDLFDDSKGRSDRDEMYLACRNSIDGLFEEVKPAPVRKPRLIG